MNRSLLCLFAVLMAVALAACASAPNLLDDSRLDDISLLSGEPCEAPCWNGIVPGETGYRDAKILIEDDERFDNIQESEPQEDSSLRAFSFSVGEVQCCQIMSRDGEMIDSMFLQLAPVMALGPALDQHGDPDFLLGGEVSEDQAYMALIWNDVPMVVFVFVAGAAEGALSADSEIINLMYMSESEIQPVMDCAKLYLWEGYQPYADYVDEDYDFVGQDADNEEKCPTG